MLTAIDIFAIEYVDAFDQPSRLSILLIMSDVNVELEIYNYNFGHIAPLK